VFAVFIDTVHRGGDAFIVSLGIDHEGHKHPLGFWQGATENSDICRELFADMQRRGLALSKKTLWVTDGELPVGVEDSHSRNQNLTGPHGTNDACVHIL